MSRGAYFFYLLARVAEALAVAVGSALAADILQRLAWIHPPRWALASLGPLAWWTWPAVWAVAGHLLLGPKQRRPIYLRAPGALYVYAGVRVDPNAGCRGGLITGTTGSGKTLCCILPRLHSICIHAAGSERPGWRSSAAGRSLASQRRAHRRLLGESARQTARLTQERARAQEALGQERANRAALAVQAPPASHPASLEAIDAEAARLQALLDQSTAALHRLADACRTARFLEPPWGGFVCGEKGNEWQAMEALMRHHGREEDLCVLRTRPLGAPAAWRPIARLNLLAMASVPADTYAQILVDTAAAVEEPAGRDEFFVTQARDKIAWGLRLAQSAACAGPQPAACPSLPAILDLLTVHESYRRFVASSMAANPSLAGSDPFLEARHQLEENYWSQPPEQLGGVRSTVYNYLIAYAEPEIAEVFCADSTLDLRDVEKGKVLCLAIPQRLALQRRYVATLLKSLVYRVVLERFDQQRDGEAWRGRNIILVEQDEWQRHAVRADCETDIVREARGAVYAATQSQNAVWLRMGGREKAAPMIANLRNRWICQAATDDCAEESSALLGARLGREWSYSHGESGRTTSVALREAPHLPKRGLRALAPFQVIFAPAEGAWLYRRCIAMPATADGRIPPWWFGDWNPLHWAGDAVRALLGRGRGARVPPWRAAAPFRAQLRWLAGLDGTFIVLGGERKTQATRAWERK